MNSIKIPSRCLLNIKCERTFFAVVKISSCFMCISRRQADTEQSWHTSQRQFLLRGFHCLASTSNCPELTRSICQPGEESAVCSCHARRTPRRRTLTETGSGRTKTKNIYFFSRLLISGRMKNNQSGQRRQLVRFA